MPNDIAPIEDTKPLVQAPKVVLEQAREAAQALQGVIASKKKKVEFNGEQYLEFEDWQTLARFYGYTVKTGKTEEIWRENQLLGYKAEAMVFQNGVEVGGAEASCMRDEKNWVAKPEFQLKSMAQTRAGAKALRNVLAWVAVLAGFKPTPAEEMQEVFATPVTKPNDFGPEVPDEPCLKCKTGSMKYRHGMKGDRAWAGYFCQSCGNVSWVNLNKRPESTEKSEEIPFQ